MTVPEDWVPEACTLPTSERPLRLAEFGELFTWVLRSERVHDTRLDLVLPADVESAARDVARRESECCSFFTFEFDGAGDDVVMRIEVPVAHTDVLDAIERAQSQ
ncbi:hypothetical protein [Mycolicibacterium gadium]|uniref:Arsenate reductase n=1 Tax=Mycolicibacterium gadium TaxID=1794 RepID=A0A7I7WH45_MYCGU|nr:hypothetical protein [Mycolicibacterium gadium]BBZ16187.1 hypothetical protein MGAD_05220 [Mycolicibacterium gadium]